MIHYFKILVLIVSINSFSQVKTSEIDTSKIELQFLEYIEALENKDFNKAVEYLPKSLFKIVPKSQMLNVLSETFDNPDIDFGYSRASVLKVDSLKLIENNYYALLEYEAILKMRINDKNPNESPSERIERIDSHKSLIKEMFGENVRAYDSVTEYFDVYEKKKAFAISNIDGIEWKFLVIDHESQKLREIILPKELMNVK